MGKRPLGNSLVCEMGAVYRGSPILSRVVWSSSVSHYGCYYGLAARFTSSVTLAVMP